MNKSISIAEFSDTMSEILTTRPHPSEIRFHPKTGFMFIFISGIEKLVGVSEETSVTFEDGTPFANLVHIPLVFDSVLPVGEIVLKYK